ncbi:unnamed protein product, partial [Symbiodinium microadriaticum]
VEVFAQARDVASQENDHPGPPSTVEEDGWEPPPRPSMPAMPGPPSLAGIAADATLGFTPEGRSSLHDSLLEGSDDVDADLPGVGILRHFPKHPLKALRKGGSPKLTP